MNLAAHNLAPSTIASCLNVGDNLLVWLRTESRPSQLDADDRRTLEAFLAALGERVSPATVAKQYRSLQQLCDFLVKDGELEESPMERMRQPKVPVKPVARITDDDLPALLDVMKGNTFEQRRDSAILRFLVDMPSRPGPAASSSRTSTKPKASPTSWRRVECVEQRPMVHEPLMLYWAVTAICHIPSSRTVMSVRARSAWCGRPT